MMGKPNIILILTDDQRFDTIASLGNRVIHTPNIDQLVHHGTAFTHACIPCGTNGAICMPSRAMLHTGRTLFHLQDSGREIPGNHTTLGEAFRDAGYRTFGTGKWHNGRASYHRSFTDGAEIFFGGMTDHWNVPAYDFDSTGLYTATLPYCPDPFRSKTVERHHGDHISNGRHSSEMVCRAGAEWIRAYDDDAPFFVSISFLAPHDPRTMPDRFRDMYDPRSISLPPNFTGGHPFDNGRLRGRDEMLAPHPRDPDTTREHIADYYAMITHLDDELGKILHAVEEKSLIENTLFVFAGDNGLALGQHGLFGKQNCYDHSVRVPLIFSGPGVPKGVKTDALCYLLDIFPTLCDLAEIDRPDSVEGTSLLPAMTRPETAVRESLFYAFESTQRALYRDGCKLIEYVVDGRNNMTQLFDVANDPWETRNLAPEHPEKAAAMRRELRCFADAWGDPESEWGKTFWGGMGD